MSAKAERLYRIESMLRRGRKLTFQDMLNELEVSKATLKRDLQFLRHRLDAPINYNRAEDTYELGVSPEGGRRELAGLWFNSQELHALLTSHHLLSSLDGNGALSRHVGPLLERIHKLIGQSEKDKTDVIQRISVRNVGQRPVEAPCFELVCSALLERKRLHFKYATRSRKAESQRKASPQRLIHYRNTWYMDAWCHTNNDLRRFALDAMSDVSTDAAKCKEVTIGTVEKALDGGYGAYAGNDVQWATLRFSAQAAQWVAREQWHPNQQATQLSGGRLDLKVPYVDLTELRMDVMRHGPEVEVLQPKELREQIAENLRKTLAIYMAAR